MTARRWGRKRLLLVAYAALLVVSHVVRLSGDAPSPPAPNEVLLPAVEQAEAVGPPVRLAYDDLGPRDPAAPVVLLIHGSPGSGADFTDMAAALGGEARVLVPDLPGFGRSERDLPDYASLAHAVYLDQLLDELAVRRAHLVAFSMGGAVALRLADLSPERVASLTMLSAVGVQELELLGEYHLNHLVHGLQLALIRFALAATPHMGWLDDRLLGVPYARNFFDTDQRPLRGILETYDGPMLILHGRRDVLVSVAVAREHHRVVPQSELELFDASHFMVFVDGEGLASRVARFVGRVERGEAHTRDTAAPARAARAAAPFDPAAIPRAHGLTLLVFMLLIAAATLVSEDLTCAAVGWMAAAGRIGFVPGTVACILGIFIGDLLLFLAGRWLGRPVLRRAPFRWLVSPARVEAARAWMGRRGPAVIFISRFTPGARLPTYLVAGMVGVRPATFAGYFLLAAGAWTPILVGLAMAFGARVRPWLEGLGRYSLVGLIVVALGVLVMARVVLPLATWRGRRRLVSAWRRWTRWEFWPLWLFYPPVLAWIGVLAIRHRHPTLFTAANPAIEAGGVIGESKSLILAGLARGSPGAVARFRTVEGGPDIARRMSEVQAFLAEEGLAYPVVLKPDLGQRGLAVSIAADAAAAEAHLRRHRGDLLVQEHVGGEEFGVFYYRLPGEERGRIFSITEKRLPEVAGDGRRSVEELVLADPRAVALARVYLERLGPDLARVPAPGERVRLVDIGTHCRGAVFLDGSRHRTEALESAVDALSRGFEGFFFGRYDLRVPSAAHLRQGRALRVIELNGVTSEATHIYDPSIRLAEAYRVLFRQWSLAFEIGRRNRDRGHPVAGPLALLRAWVRFHAHHDSRHEA